MGCKAQIDFPGQIALVRQSAHMSSIAQDAAAGRRLELETMFLAPLRMAREHGVATPTLDLLVALCTLRARTAGAMTPTLATSCAALPPEGAAVGLGRPGAD